MWNVFGQRSWIQKSVKPGNGGKVLIEVGVDKPGGWKTICFKQKKSTALQHFLFLYFFYSFSSLSIIMMGSGKLQHNGLLVRPL